MIHSKTNKRYQIKINAVLVPVALIMILPLVLLLMSSITSERALLVNGYSFFPKEFSLDAYKYIWQNRLTILNAYRNTVVVTGAGTIIHVLLASMLAYPLSVRNLPGRNIFNFVILFTMLFNGGTVPSYLMWTEIFHIKNSLYALLLPSLLLSAMNVMLMRSYFMNNIPPALYEAAKIDGASYFRIYWTVVMPLGKPIIVTVGLFAGLNYWNDWINGLYYVSKPKYYGIQSLLNKMIMDIQALQANASSASGAAAQIPQVSIRMAIAIVALLPILAVYPFLQKYLASGIALGAVKG